MVTTIGIDPHKATHTAVAIDEAEVVLGEITISADRYQIDRLTDWVGKVNGDHPRVWAVEAAGGLGYLLSQQLVANGEHVVDVPAVPHRGQRARARGGFLPAANVRYWPMAPKIADFSCSGRSVQRWKRKFSPLTSPRSKGLLSPEAV